MRFIEAIVALAALTSHATAYEAEDGAEATWSQVDSGRKVWRHPASEMKRTILKFGGNVSDEIENAIAQAKTSGSVRTKPIVFDALYLTPTKVGTPPKVHMMDIDTGSSDLWFYSTFQPRSQSKGRAIYNPARSSTSKRTSGRFNVLYGDGSTAKGPVFFDKVSVAGVSTRTGFGAASSVKGVVTQNPGEDGLFGFAFSKLNTAGVPTWFAASKLKKDVLGVDLRHQKPGFYDVGFINKNHFSGPIHYAPVNRASGFWEFKAAGAKFAGTTKRKSFVAIADTGTSIALAPTSIVKAYYRKVKGAFFEPEVAGYIFPCSVTPPAFSFIIGGSARTIPGKLISFQPVGTVNGKEFCIGGIQKNTGLQGMSILGDTFLKTQYVVFDSGNNRIGFANK